MEINRLVLPVRGGLADSSETTAAKGRARFRYLEETHSVKDPREEGMERYASDLGRDTLSLTRAVDAGYEGDDEKRCTAIGARARARGRRRAARSSRTRPSASSRSSAAAASSSTSQIPGVVGNLVLDTPAQADGRGDGNPLIHPPAMSSNLQSSFV